MPLRYAREAADASGLPIMVHPQGAWCASLDDILGVMQERDILTHSYHGRSHGILDEEGRVRHAVRGARERGIFFDVGHGAGSFSWRVCETALAQGFPPTTISSDLHTQSLHGPVFDLATTVSKFLHLGLSLEGLPDLLFLQRIGDGGVTHLFDCHELVAQASIGRLVHCPHPALSYLLDDEIAIGEHGVG